MVIRDTDTTQQKPSRLLLLALMDLVDIEGGNNFESMASVDKAGLKHVLLAYGNYTTFYIPNKELISTNGKKVIPVVTQYSAKHNLVSYDTSRSMICTYTVVMPTTGEGNGKSYFVQEVLFVPGLESPELLKRVMGNKFEFWDMTLEVPTHFTALTPFQQIQPFQLLHTEYKTPSTQSNNDALVSRMEEIHPMCCMLGTASADMLKKKRDASVDCFTETQRYCDDGNTKIVSECEELFKDKTLDNVTKAQKMWHALVKRDTSKIKDRELVEMHVNANVLFLKLCTYHNKLKGPMVGEGEHVDLQSRSSSPHSTEAQDADVSSKCLAEVEEHSKDMAIAGVSEKNDYSIVTPEAIPISMWIKNMSTLLLSEPWLNDDNLRREAVCNLLGLDNTLLDRRYGDILRDWVINNRTVVNILQSYGLQDRLSNALVDCLASTSTDNWRCKARDSQAHSLRRRYSHDDDHPWLGEAEEVNSEEEECHEDEDEIPSDPTGAARDSRKARTPQPPRRYIFISECWCFTVPGVEVKCRGCESGEVDQSSCMAY
ncbi:unnamed protein product [Lota lota]